MKWDTEEHKVKTIFYVVATLILIVALVGMLTDFISWKDAVGLIKKNVPTNGVGSIAIQNVDYSPLSWRGPLKGRIYLFADQDLNVDTRTVRWNEKEVAMDGTLDGAIPSLSGVDLPLKRISSANNPLVVSYGKGTIENSKGEHSFEIWVYLLDKGEKVYKKVFTGYKAVDYPITPAIVNTYRNRIDPDRTITQKDIDWLCTFTHDSLHKYILSFFENSKVPELFQKPNVYAYRLDQEISSKVQWKKTYKNVWTNERKGACVGIIYKLDEKTYVRVVYNAWYIGCKGGGYIFNFWR